MAKEKRKPINAISHVKNLYVSGVTLYFLLPRHKKTKHVLKTSTQCSSLSASFARKFHARDHVVPCNVLHSVLL